MNALDELDEVINTPFEDVGPYSIPQEGQGDYMAMAQPEFQIGEQLPEPLLNLTADPAPATIEFSQHGEMKLTIDLNDGTYTLGEGVEIDEATELFWTVLADRSPAHLLNQLEEAEETIAELLTYKTIALQNEEAQAKIVKLEGQGDYDRAMKVIS